MNVSAELTRRMILMCSFDPDELTEDAVVPECVLRVHFPDLVNGKWTIKEAIAALSEEQRVALNERLEQIVKKGMPKPMPYDIRPAPKPNPLISRRSEARDIVFFTIAGMCDVCGTKFDPVTSPLPPCIIETLFPHLSDEKKYSKSKWTTDEAIATLTDEALFSMADEMRAIEKAAQPQGLPADFKAAPEARKSVVLNSTQKMVLDYLLPMIKRYAPQGDQFDPERDRIPCVIYRAFVDPHPRDISLNEFIRDATSQQLQNVVNAKEEVQRRMPRRVRLDPISVVESTAESKLQTTTKPPEITSFQQDRELPLWDNKEYLLKVRAATGDELAKLLVEGFGIKS